MDGLSLAFLEPEWERLELLGRFLFRNRRAREVSREEIHRMDRLQEEVDGARRPGGGWDRLVAEPLSRMEFDVLACALGPVVAPRIGWMYRNLQGDMSRAFPSPELITELFCLDLEGGREVHKALSEDAPLRTGGLIKSPGDGSFSSIEPESWVREKLLGLDRMDKPPPGARRLRVLGDWESLALSGNRQNLLLEFLIWIRHGDMGGDMRRANGGPVALFSGPWTTGKTLAAGFLANELGWPLFKVESEGLCGQSLEDSCHRIDALFDDAGERPMVLLFHDGDGFFSTSPMETDSGPRSLESVRAHLLRRLETHNGPCIVSTEVPERGDSILNGRADMVVAFPSPRNTNTPS